MATQSAAALREKKCEPCEGGVSPLSASEAKELLQNLDGWELTDGDKKIRRKWETADFVAGIEFLSKVADLAEEEGHHPDVHLTGYRNVTIELTTHAIGGLSENDFIVAAKIDELPVKLNADNK
ncbi:MAG: 4a-hydroxytetrahydrobiopterin dehydratase [Planctomycetota bacterium]|nr:MAG: 4a-hydroxytetrahydrobiopterin dehydratase [Planctomycetota bacterium]REJ96004.1 MAG: 4a-hydroxytetrahydrobiopterin dehydratase [Planctomycetota bacterium]REK20430.1 MAG: 4a-hydroxytetrahydrobiopterin dehydratase [Planctomycetota bacterium]REK29277.1 MAG: 4a-hydroxytetrahydrobiopterin dehydratase [Planctomycetota bacterium]